MTTWRLLMKIRGSGSASGSISQRYGSANPHPDPYQNLMDPQHCIRWSGLVGEGVKTIRSSVAPNLHRIYFYSTQTLNFICKTKVVLQGSVLKHALMETQAKLAIFKFRFTGTGNFSKSVGRNLSSKTMSNLDFFWPSSVKAYFEEWFYSWSRKVKKDLNKNYFAFLILRRYLASWHKVIFYWLYSRFDIQERLFFSLADELIRTRRLPGIITGISLMINVLF